MSQEEKAKPKITVVVTGILGSGKSAACNFFLQENVFDSRFAFGSVTGAAQSSEKIVGGTTLELVDTPGFLDPSSASTEQEISELSQAILQVPNGIHALSIVLKSTNRITAEECRTLLQFLSLVELIPYTFLIFSHAKALAETDNDQKQAIKEMLNDSKCPQILPEVLQRVNYRYIVLESTMDMGKGYHDIKVNEFTKIVESILTVNKGPFTCFWTNISKVLQENLDREKFCNAVKQDLQKLQLQMKKESSRSFWEKWSIWIATGIGASVGAAAGTVLGPGGSVVGAGLGSSCIASLLSSGTGAAVGSIAGGGTAAAVNKYTNVTKMCIIQ